MYDFTYTPKSIENPQFLNNDEFVNLLVKTSEELKDSGDDRKAYIVRYAATRIESLSDDLDNSKKIESINDAYKFIGEQLKYYKNQLMKTNK